MFPLRRSNCSPADHSDSATQHHLTTESTHHTHPAESSHLCPPSWVIWSLGQKERLPRAITVLTLNSNYWIGNQTSPEAFRVHSSYNIFISGSTIIATAFLFASHCTLSFSQCLSKFMKIRNSFFFPDPHKRGSIFWLFLYSCHAMCVCMGHE